MHLYLTEFPETSQPARRFSPAIQVSEHVICFTSQTVMNNEPHWHDIISQVFRILLINFLTGFLIAVIPLWHDNFPNTYAFAAIKVDFNTTANSSCEIPSPSKQLYQKPVDTAHYIQLVKKMIFCWHL